MAQVIVQLSDIHFSVNHTEHPISDRMEYLCGAIRSMLQHGDECFIVVCGDVANWGKPEEYALAQDMLFSLMDGVRTHLGGVSPNLIIVPGNHDLDFDLHDSLRDLVLASETAGREVDKAQHEYCLRPQEHFRKFAQDFVTLADAHVVTGLLDTRIYEVEGGYLTFHLLNTPRATQKQEMPGALRFPAEELKVQLASSGSDGPVVAVLHHPYNWFEPTNASEIRRALETTCDLILTGHEHDSGIWVKDRGGNEQSLYMEGGVLQNYDDPDNSAFNVIRLDAGIQAFRSWTFRWQGDGYDTDFAGTEHRFLRQRQSLRHEFQVREEWEEWLEQVGTDLRHPRCARIRLTDVFCYPDCRRSQSHDAGSEIIRGRDLIPHVLGSLCTLITGADRIGKTSLAKRLFTDLREAGLIPILLGRNFHVPANGNMDEGGRIRGALSSAYESIYSSPSPARYWQTSVAERAVIIDDYHRFEKLGPVGRRKLLAWLRENVGIVVIFAGPGIRFEELVEGDTGDDSLWNCEQISLLESGRWCRFQLIRKWVELGHDSFEESPDDLYRKTIHFQTIIDRFVGNNALPSTPQFVSMMLQQLETKTGIDDTTGLYGHLYERIIKDWIALTAHDGPDLEAKLNYLSEFAYRLRTTGVVAMPEPDFEIWHQKYCDEHDLPLQRERLVTKLSEIGVLTQVGDSIRFRFRYYYCYFVARYVAVHIHEEAALAEEVGRLCTTLHLRDSAHIMMFLCHLARDPAIIAKVLDTANSHFADESEYDLLVPPAIFPDELACQSHLALSECRPEENREEMLKAADCIDRPNALDEHGEYSTDADEEVPALAAEMTAAQYSLQLCGHILRNYYGYLRGEDKVRLLQACLKLGLRSMGGLFRLIERQREDFASGIADIVRRQHPEWTEAEVHLGTLTFIQSVAMGVAYHFVKSTADAVGIPQVSVSLTKAIGPCQTVSHRLVSAAAHLDYGTSFPKIEVEDLHYDLKRGSLASELLRFLVWEHFRLFNTDYRVRQEICSRLDIHYGSEATFLAAPKRLAKR